jgi:hypothetical protein
MQTVAYRTDVKKAVLVEGCVYYIKSIHADGNAIVEAYEILYTGIIGRPRSSIFYNDHIDNIYLEPIEYWTSVAGGWVDGEKERTTLQTYPLVDAEQISYLFQKNADGDVFGDFVGANGLFGNVFWDNYAGYTGLDSSEQYTALSWKGSPLKHKRIPIDVFISGLSSTETTRMVLGDEVPVYTVFGTYIYFRGEKIAAPRHSWPLNTSGTQGRCVVLGAMKAIDGNVFLVAQSDHYGAPESITDDNEITVELVRPGIYLTLWCSNIDEDKKRYSIDGWNLIVEHEYPRTGLSWFGDRERSTFVSSNGDTIAVDGTLTLNNEDYYGVGNDTGNWEEDSGAYWFDSKYEMESSAKKYFFEFNDNTLSYCTVSSTSNFTSIASSEGESETNEEKGEILVNTTLGISYSCQKLQRPDGSYYGQIELSGYAEPYQIWRSTEDGHDYTNSLTGKIYDNNGDLVGWSDEYEYVTLEQLNQISCYQETKCKSKRLFSFIVRDACRQSMSGEASSTQVPEAGDIVISGPTSYTSLENYTATGGVLPYEWIAPTCANPVVTVRSCRDGNTYDYEAEKAIIPPVTVINTTNSVCTITGSSLGNGYILDGQGVPLYRVYWGQSKLPVGLAITTLADIVGALYSYTEIVNLCPSNPNAKAINNAPFLHKFITRPDGQLGEIIGLGAPRSCACSVTLNTWFDLGSTSQWYYRAGPYGTSVACGSCTPCGFSLVQVNASGIVYCNNWLSDSFKSGLVDSNGNVIIVPDSSNGFLVKVHKVETLQCSL